MFSHATDAGWVSRSHRAIQPFRLEKPATIADAVTALATDDAVAIAGGIDLTRRMRSGDTHGVVVDLSGIASLKGIGIDGEEMRIGALVTHWEIETSAVLADSLPTLQAAWKTIGNVRVRMAGTVGGNIMAGEAGYDGRVLLGALAAELVFETDAGAETVAASSALDGLPGNALLTEIRVPLNGGTKLSFDRSLKPVVSVGVATDGRDARVGIGCAFAAPRFWDGQVEDVDAELGAAFDGILSNPMGSAGYRRRMIGTLARRQLDALLEG